MSSAFLSHRTDRGLRIEPRSAGDLAHFLDGLLEGDSARIVCGATTLRVASSEDVVFWTGKEWTGEVRHTRAGVLLTTFGLVIPDDFKGTSIQVSDPYEAMCTLLRELHEPLIENKEGKISWDAHVHPSAIVEGTVWPGAQIGPHCVVPAGCEVGWNTILEAHVVLYAGVTIGKECVLQAGTVIGSRGFGFRPGPGGVVSVPHYAGVEIGSRVHIGANSVVAAGFLEPTRIGDDSKLDSFVQIAHHCQVGSRVMMASGAGLAGGVLVGDGAEFGGAAQVAQHLRIGSGARIAAKSGVTHSVDDHAVVAGFPSEPISIWRKSVIALRKLAESC
jgi:UDP-3-O-[3-hydroxymyristoyl] glucosamine N-acyltransferase